LCHLNLVKLAENCDEETMATLQPIDIEGVITVDLRVFGDERGQFMETFRREWFPQRSWEHIQTNRSESKAGVLRGLHFHRYQVDYWHVTKGSIRAGLVDLRPNSPTYLKSKTIDLHAEQPTGLYIPCGVAHGFYALTDCMLIYIVDQYYNADDENGIIWNDPQAAVPWGIDNPILSARDANNPLLADLPADFLATLG